MAEKAKRHIQALVQLQPVRGIMRLACGATTDLTLHRTSFGGDVEMAQDEVSARLLPGAKMRDD
jgi:hypothetical protein